MYRRACSMRPIGTSIALGAAQPRRGYVLERARERRPILGRRRLSRQTRVTKRAPFLCRGRSVRILPRHASRGWSRVGTPGWP